MNFLKTISGFAAIAVVATGLGGTAVNAASMGSDESIKLALNEWTGQHISTKAAGMILEKMGYKVEYISAGYYPQMTALTEGTITATLEIWSSNIGEHYNEAIDSGKAVAIGDLGLTPVETWYYNNAAQAACPGLPDWKALKGCADKFVSADTYPKGRLVDYPADWGTINVDVIKGLELPFTSVPAGSEGSAIAEIKSAEIAGEPLLVMFWEPHWLFAEVSLNELEMPAYSDACFEDASAGLNPNATHDCGWKRGRVYKIAWSGMEEKWPAAFAFLNSFTMTNADQIPMMNEIDQKGNDLDKVVADWVAANESNWQAWIDAAKAK